MIFFTLGKNLTKININIDKIIINIGFIHPIGIGLALGFYIFICGKFLCTYSLTHQRYV